MSADVAQRVADAPMHVLLVSNRFDTDPGAGGTEILTADLADALVRRGVGVSWLVAAEPSESSISPDPEQGRVGRVRVAAPPTTSPPAGWRAREGLTTARIDGTLRSLPAIDLVHFTHFSRLGLDFLNHGQLRGIPAVATLTDYTSACGDFQLIHRQSGRPCLPPVAAETCASCLRNPDSASPTAVEIESWRRRNLGVLNDRCHGVWVQTPHQARRLVDAGLRTKIIADRASYCVPASWRRRPPPPEGPATLLFLGRASAEKGLHVLLDAFAAWRRPARLRVVTTPDDDAYERRLRRAASADARVEWRPPVGRDELVDLLNDAHALVVPSQWDENHPMVMQYAIALGVPVLCSAVSSLAHLAAPPAVRLVEQHDDPAAWTRAFEDLAGQPPMVSDRTEQVRHDYEDFVDATVDVYRKVTGR